MKKFLALLMLLPSVLLGQTTPTTQVKTVADLVALNIPGVATRFTALVTGRLTTNDGGGGTFYYDANNATATNLGTIFKPGAANGRWVREHVGSVLYAEWFGIVTNGTQAANQIAATNWVVVGKATGSTLQFGAGIYDILTNFPLRQTGTVTTNEDYNGMIIRGVGRATVIRTRPVTGGADVFQLNGVKNVTIEDLSVASILGVDIDEGSNGISVTGGGENIIVQRCYFLNLPYEDTGVGYPDGGSGLSIQRAGTDISNEYRNIKFLNNSIFGGAFGINVIYSGSGVLTNPPRDIIISGNSVSNSFRGINVESSGTGATQRPIMKMNGIVSDNTILDCQQGIFMDGVTGWAAIGNRISSSIEGVPAFVIYTTNKYAASIVSSRDIEFIGNRIWQTNGVYYMIVAGGGAAEANTPSDRIKVIGNSFSGTAQGYGIQSSANAAYLWATNSYFIGNTFQGVTTNYDTQLITSGLNLVIDTADGSVFPNIVHHLDLVSIGSTVFAPTTGLHLKGAYPYGYLIVERTGLGGVGAAAGVAEFRTDINTVNGGILLSLVGVNSAAANKSYGQIVARIDDPVAATEDSTWMWNTLTAGAATEVLRLSGLSGGMLAPFAIGASAPSSTAILDLTSTNKAAILPRMTKAARDAIVGPVNGSIIYQTDGTAGMKAYVGGAWNTLNITADP